MRQIIYDFHPLGGNMGLRTQHPAYKLQLQSAYETLNCGLLYVCH